MTQYKDDLKDTIISYIAGHIFSSGVEIVAPLLFSSLHTIIEIANNSDNHEFILQLKEHATILLQSLPDDLFIAEDGDIN